MKDALAPTHVIQSGLGMNSQVQVRVFGPSQTLQPHNSDMSLSDYLAKNYLTADSDKKSKKRKRKNKDGGLKIDDDDDLSGWNKGADDDDEDGPTIGMNMALGFINKKHLLTSAC